MKGRLIMRKIAVYDWDTILPKDLCTEAADWMKEVEKAAETTKVPRLVDCKNLLVYVDASQYAWGVDVRSPEGIRVVARGGLFDKEKFAKWSIVRKEMLALVHGRECIQEVWNSVDPKEKSECRALLLSDSQINCYRLHKDLQSKDMKAWERKTVESLHDKYGTVVVSW
ncbi:hypothetical protein FOZ63_020067 [Perkinsus olseni]|uniref:Uncharacterized protein n=1 Tax=Perkinsus olseni TaxID=32597 RepID=A0A7J6SNQ2_PEROL|nr:hypothetical protein FOZ63_020067 [Perkinsus olseni]